MATTVCLAGSPEQLQLDAISECNEDSDYDELACACADSRRWPRFRFRDQASGDAVRLRYNPFPLAPGF
ncbi:MAG: hypothetical protein FWG25_05720 [Promicromonosporaceae bacterium]|nr:hypothetical protein [Promicromonosporaceae bacterium]